MYLNTKALCVTFPRYNCDRRTCHISVYVHYYSHWRRRYQVIGTTLVLLQQKHHLCGTISRINLVWMIQIDDNLENSNPGYVVDAVKCPSHITGATLLSGWLYVKWYCDAAGWHRSINILVFFDNINCTQSVQYCMRSDCVNFVAISI